MADTENTGSPLVPLPVPEHTNAVASQLAYYDPTSQGDLGPYVKRRSGPIGHDGRLTGEGFADSGVWKQV
jgi:hypothetical protein